MDSPSQYQALPDNSPSDLKQPLLSASETPKQPLGSASKTSNQGWLIFSLILILISKFAYSLVATSLEFILFNKKMQLNSDVRGYVPVLPVICGFLIYRFEAKRVYQLIAVISALAVALAAVGVERGDDTFIKFGYSAFSESYMGFSVVQIYTIINCFKAKGLSLVMGVSYFLPNIVGRLMQTLCPFWSYTMDLNLRNLPWSGLTIPHLMMISCLVGTCVALILAKIDVKTQTQEEGSRQSLIEHFRSIKPISYVLMGGMFFFILINDSTRAPYLIAERIRADQMNSLQFHWNRVNRFSLFIVFGACILIDWLADKKGKRIIIMLSSFLMVLSGFLILPDITRAPWDSRFIALAIVLQDFASYLFAISSWRCLSNSIPQRVLGIVLGLTFAVANLRKWNDLVDLSICKIAWIFGIILMIAGLVMDMKNNGSSNSVNVEENDKKTGRVLLV